jgi:hypothetical protein
VIDDLGVPESPSPGSSHDSNVDVLSGPRRLRVSENPGPAIVAVPMKDEAAYLGGCLTALTLQTKVPDEIPVPISNSSGRRAAIAGDFVLKSPVPMLVAKVALPSEEAHAGGALRRRCNGLPCAPVKKASC